MAKRNASIQWLGAEYVRAVSGATTKALRKAAKVTAAEARRTAPRAGIHRVRRTYPGGRAYDNPRRIYQSITHGARERRHLGLIFAWARVAMPGAPVNQAGVKAGKGAGYAQFVEHGFRTARGGRVAPRHFMRNSLERVKPRVIAILRGEMNAGGVS